MIGDFINEWLKKRVEESISAAGPRYTPEIDVNLPISKLFDALGRTQNFFDEIKLNLKKVKKAYFRNGLSDLPLDIKNNLSSLISDLHKMTQETFSQVSNIQPSPIEKIPLDFINKNIQTLHELSNNLLKKLQETKNNLFFRRDEGTSPNNNESKKFENIIYQWVRFISELRSFEHFINKPEIKLGNVLSLLLLGDAGTGKSHLFCDVARKRIQAGLPTILLMGQQFLEVKDPWSQIKELLQLPVNTSRDDFLGSLNSLAEVNNTRALILIDALNEGQGNKIWPDNIAPLLTTIKSYPRISIAVSVRSCYEQAIIPKEITNIIRFQHTGFAGQEHEAIPIFCEFYNIELPSFPTFAEEFQNPLFLKILCKGLQKEFGKAKFPRGLSGITAVFYKFLEKTNEKLANHKYLNYSNDTHLVQKIVYALAKKMAKNKLQWLSVEKAEKIIKKISPNQDSAKFLQYLVEEGLIIKNQTSDRKNPFNNISEVVYFAYQRFADHLIVEHLLNKYFDTKQPTQCFQPDAPLGFLTERSWQHSSLMSAICIQLPETRGIEFPELLLNQTVDSTIIKCFIESIIWRDPKSFTDRTDRLLCLLYECSLESGYLPEEILNMFLMVSTIPQHPYNADFLHNWLMPQEMATRDATWSTFLHSEYENSSHTIIHKLIDWAWFTKDKTHIDKESLLLYGTVLAWFLTTSNRVLRDRATKALANLFTNQLHTLEKLIDKFRNVNDVYVLERLLATAYGCVLRSTDITYITSLAKYIYDWIFNTDYQIPHILLRDYARCLIEYALGKESITAIDINKIKPPYRSDPPVIPTSGDIKDKKYKGRIHFSVMHDDFSRDLCIVNKWLSVKISEPIPQHPRDIFKEFRTQLGFAKVEKWQEWEKSYLNLITLIQNLKEESPELIELLRKNLNSEGQNSADESVSQRSAPQEEKPHEKLTALFSLLEQETQLKQDLYDALAEQEREFFETIIIPCLEKKIEPITVLRFDLRQAQRWTIKRAVDFGWIQKETNTSNKYRSSYKDYKNTILESSGNKYQWIACYELLARLADNFQYNEPFSDTPLNDKYDGPWQLGVRNIDPSCLLKSTKEKLNWRPSKSSWWFYEKYDFSNTPVDDVAWIKQSSDLPDVKSLLQRVNPENKSEWLLLNGHHDWTQETPLDEDSYDVPHRKIWYSIQSYLVKLADIEEIFRWSIKQKWWQHSDPSLGQVFLGEFCWAPAYRYNNHFSEQAGGWQQDTFNKQPKPIMRLTETYLNESAVHDFSTEETYHISLPKQFIVNQMNLTWKGVEGSYFDQGNNLIAFDPSIRQESSTMLLMNYQAFLKFLADNNYTVLWTIIGEKLIFGGHDEDWKGRLSLRGAYRLLNNKIDGKISSTFKPH